MLRHSLYKQICSRPIKQPAAYCQPHKMTRHQLTTFSWLEVVLEADSSYKEWKDPLNGSSSSSSGECVANTIIPPQSRPEATLLLAGELADEMLHDEQCQCLQHWYSRVSRRALQHSKTVGKELTV